MRSRTLTDRYVRAGAMWVAAVVALSVGCGGGGSLTPDASIERHPAVAADAAGRGSREASPKTEDGALDGPPRDAMAEDMLKDAFVDAMAEAPGDAMLDSGTVPLNVINVTTSDVNNVDDGLCSLLEAILAVNTHTAVNTDDCPAGTGNDVISLPQGAYQVPVALTPTETVEIRGAGKDKTVLTFEDNPLGCGVFVSATGKAVWLTNMTLAPSAVDDAPVALTGACVTDGTLRVRHAEVKGFSAGGLLARGGDGGTAKIEVLNSLIDDNHSQNDGAGIAFVGSNTWIWVEQSAIIDNVSEGLGGGIFGSGAGYANYIVNTTISGNEARRGGAIASNVQNHAYLGLYWSTVVNNHAQEVGGGLYVQVDDGDTATTLIVGDIVTSNRADQDPAQANLNANWGSGVGCYFSLLTLPASIPPPGTFEDSCRFNVSDPKLGPLMDMGGAEHLPMYALLPGSPAVDAISEANSYMPTEQRDTWNTGAGDPLVGTEPGQTPGWKVFGRIFDGDPLEDMGSYELEPRWETELLTVADAGIVARPYVVATTPDGYSHGAGTNLEAEATGDYVTFQAPVPEAATYAIAVGVLTTTSSGAFQLSVADAVDGVYVPVGAAVDTYVDTHQGNADSSAGTFQKLELGNIEISSAGQKYFRFTVTGKNDSSTGYGLFLDYIESTRQ